METARLALFALGVALITSRVGLVVHELVGHGVTASAFGAEIEEVRLYATAGGWISYDRDHPWTWTEALVVQLAGIAVELVMGAAAAVAAWRTRGALAVALGGAALGLCLHAGFYLAAGTYHGLGDGALLHRRLGDDRGWLCWPIAAAMVGGCFVGARRLAAIVRVWLPTPSATRQLMALTVALAAAAGAHAGLASAEVALRPSPTYQAIMKPERQRVIDQDLARWAAAEQARGKAPDRGAVAAHRRRLETERPRPLPFGAILAIALALATAAGAALGRPRPGDLARLPQPAVRRAVTWAVIAALSISAIDALAA